MRANAEHLLEPDEQIQEIFSAQTTSQWFALISYWIIILSNAYRVVVVTNKRILVAKAGRLSTTKVNEVLHELPRSTKIGPASGLWFKTELGGEKQYIHKRFHKDVDAADAGAA